MTGMLGIDDALQRVEAIRAEFYRNQRALLGELVALEQQANRDVQSLVRSGDQVSQARIQQLSTLEQQANRDVQSLVQSGDQVARERIQQLAALEQQLNEHMQVLAQRCNAMVLSVPFVSKDPTLFDYSPKKIVFGENQVFFYGSFPRIGEPGYTPKLYIDRICGLDEKNSYLGSRSWVEAITGKIFLISALNGVLVFAIKPPTKFFALSDGKLPQRLFGGLSVPWGKRYGWFGKMERKWFRVSFSFESGSL